MTLQEAREILGSPTHHEEDNVRWYFNFVGRHVFPGLKATLHEGKLTDWEVYLG